MQSKTSLDYNLIPLLGCHVQAGFPSPADDYLEDIINLNDYLIPRPAATFFLRASGDSMEGVGIRTGDLLVVDKSITARHNQIVIAAVNGELTVKRLHKQKEVKLMPANPKYLPIIITEDIQLVIWGVVLHIIHSPSSCSL